MHGVRTVVLRKEESKPEGTWVSAGMVCCSPRRRGEELAAVDAAPEK